VRGPVRSKRFAISSFFVVVVLLPLQSCYYTWLELIATSGDTLVIFGGAEVVSLDLSPPLFCVLFPFFEFFPPPPIRQRNPMAKTSHESVYPRSSSSPPPLTPLFPLLLDFPLQVSLRLRRKMLRSFYSCRDDLGPWNSLQFYTPVR